MANPTPCSYNCSAFPENTVYPVCQSPKARPTLDSLLPSLFLDLSKSGQMGNLNQPCPVSELELVTLSKAHSCPRCLVKSASLLVSRSTPSIHGLSSLEEGTSNLFCHLTMSTAINILIPAKVSGLYAASVTQKGNGKLLGRK